MAPEIVGLVPAAGLANRLGRLPCSKEIYPVEIAGDPSAPGAVRVAAEFLLSQFRTGGARKALVILREGKWDIPAYLGDGSRMGLSLGYLMMRHPFGTPYTIDAAQPFVEASRVLFGFPDILIELEDPFGPLLSRGAETEADIVLGLLPARRPDKVDMVDLDDEGRVRGIVIKPLHTPLRYTWLLAAWGPRFTRFLHEHLRERMAGRGEPEGRELYVGDVVMAALETGLRVESVRFERASYIDIGTPEDLREAVRGRS
jgi:glucose-1-phosphate thymidylyltransferase